MGCTVYGPLATTNLTLQSCDCGNCREGSRFKARKIGGLLVDGLLSAFGTRLAEVVFMTVMGTWTEVISRF